MLAVSTKIMVACLYFVALLLVIFGFVATLDYLMLHYGTQVTLQIVGWAMIVVPVAAIVCAIVVILVNILIRNLNSKRRRL